MFSLSFMLLRGLEAIRFEEELLFVLPYIIVVLKKNRIALSQYVIDAAKKE